MVTVKEAVLDRMGQLPQDVTYDDVLEEIELLAIQAKLRAARDDVDAGRVISQAQLEQESATWSSN